jgi:hypothetical protein
MVVTLIGQCGNGACLADSPTLALFSVAFPYRTVCSNYGSALISRSSALGTHNGACVPRALDSAHATAF